MLIPSLILFFLFFRLSASLSSSETALIALHKNETQYLIDNKKVKKDLVMHRMGFGNEFFLIPDDGEKLEHEGHRFTDAKMKKRPIDSIRSSVLLNLGESDSEAHHKE